LPGKKIFQKRALAAGLAKRSLRKVKKRPEMPSVMNIMGGRKEERIAVKVYNSGGGSCCWGRTHSGTEKPKKKGFYR